MLKATKHATRKNAAAKAAGTKKPGQRKRGIVLLVVISLLALFVLLGVSYSLVASKSNQAAQTQARIQEVGDHPEKEMDLILGQILYDTLARSSLKYHSLLGDLYGGDSVEGTVSNAPLVHTGGLGPGPSNPGPGPQVYTFEFTAAAGSTFSDINHYYTGRVITFLSGNCANHSTRILAYQAEQPGNPPITPRVPGRITIEAVESKLAGSIMPSMPPASNFIINGAPFNGAGAGYYLNTSDPTDTLNHTLVGGYRPGGTSGQPTTAFTTQYPYIPMALLPHFAGYDATGTIAPTNGGAYDAGGADESWDAVDYQNMFLAMIPPAAAQTYMDDNPQDPTTYQNNVAMIPSYIRPELINYWTNETTSPTNIPQGTNTSEEDIKLPLNAFSTNGQSQGQLDRLKNFLRTFIFRPMPWDHPDFTGSNPYFDPAIIRQQLQAAPHNITMEPQLTQAVTRELLDRLINNGSRLLNGDPPTPRPNVGLWDVDNDGDGVPDSIWIDPGLPVITTPDGRRHKRLVAILIKDLDGRFDWNAHGNLSQLVPANRPETPTSLGLATGVALRRGLGFGPAEVDFMAILGATSDPNVQQAYRNLLTGRYGPDGLPGASVPPNGTRDALSIVKHHGIPNDYANLAGVAAGTWYGRPSLYGSPPDVWGRTPVVLDYGGHPIFSAGTAPNNQNEMVDTPYELALNGSELGTDRAYTAVELEKLLRYQDADAQQLPSRPLAAAGAYLAPGYPTYTAANSEPPGYIPFASATAPTAHRRRESFGTGSFIPAPRTGILQEARAFGYYSGELYQDQNQNGKYDQGEQFTDSQPFNGVYDAPKHGSATILDLYRVRLLAGGTPPAAVATHMERIVPWEFFKGQKFDINRSFGDGIDGFDADGDGTYETSSQNGARDDAYESWQGPGPRRQYAWAGGPNSFQNPKVEAHLTNGVDANFDGSTSNIAHRTDNLYARQLYARHLYCLALLQMPEAFQPTPPHESTLADAGSRRRVVLRRIAQWAINCADFRDHDGIMTPFEFDLNPWDGWHVDGNLATNGTPTAPEVMNGQPQQPVPQTGTVTPSAAVGNPDVTDRDVVWGMEHPELLITETFAMHDRKVKDTEVAGMMDTKRDDTTNPDEDLDQFAVPQGSLYVELKNVRANLWTGAGQQANQKPQLSFELHDGSGRLELGKLSPQRPDNLTYPVWRLAVAEIPSTAQAATYDPRHPQLMGGHSAAPANSPGTNMETATFDPFDVSVLPGGTPDGPTAPGFRFAYFTDVNTSVSMSGGQGQIHQNELPLSYFNRVTGAASNPLLEPGQYAVVGPRPLTYFGQERPVDPNLLWDSAASPHNGYSNQRIDMDPTTAPPTFAVYDTTGGMAPAQTYAVPQVRPIVPIIADYETTPMGWTMGSMWTQGLNITEPLLNSPSGANYYPEPIVPKTTAGAPPELYDDPDPAVAIADGTGFKDQPLEGDTAGLPIVDAEMQETGTYQDRSSVYLQRLADPTMPYNPPPGDPNVAYMPAFPVNPYVTVDWSTIDVTVFSGSEDSTRKVGSAMDEAIDPDDPDPGVNQEVFFRTRQRGYPQTTPWRGNIWSPITLNDDSIAPADTIAAGATTGPYFRLNFSNNLDNAYTPQDDRQSLGWLNQTVDTLLTNPPGYEGEPANPAPWLTWHNRPFMNPMELLQVPSSMPSRATFELTAGVDTAALTPFQCFPLDVFDSSNDTTFRSPFAHLLNFFHATDPMANRGRGAQLYRLLEFVEVPSPYVGTEKWYNPQNFQTTQSGFYRPPFNYLSRFRDPGRININTIFDPNIFDAAIGATGLWDELTESRKGLTGNWLAMDPTSPTRFGNPFRSADSADLMPITTADNLRKRNPVEATIMRPDPTNALVPLFDNPATQPFQNADRNAYFRYQNLQKIGNVLSTNSNCYAIWMTVGFFEVEPNPTGADAGHPDGYRLMHEVGTDTGQVKRHRAFFIIDRSAPVGFKPGERLNTDECILLRRFIE